MKKFFLSAAMLIGLAFSTQAQEISKNAIGLRLGDNDGFGAEVSYQRGLSKNHRLEFDLGWRESHHYDAAKLVGIFQWNIDGGLNWYAGPGVGIGTYRYNHDGPGPDYDDNGAFVMATGDIGVEYLFDFPLQLSVDFRPEIYLNDYRDDNFGADIGISARYRF
jgi:hypothetical protein